MKNPTLYLALTCLAALSACSQKQEVQAVSYAKDVEPILAKNCKECHVPGGSGLEKTGLDMSNYDTLMKGTKFGPIVKAGDPLTSTLVMLVEGRADPSLRMPHGKEKLLDADIAKIRAWVEQGAKNN
jgi:mono/diheme cytochrome c family protein